MYPARDATRERAPPIIPMFLPAISASLFIALLLTFGPHPSQASLTGGLIAADRGRFVREDGSTFRVAGTNCFYLAYSSGADDGSYEHAWVDEVLDEAQSLKLNVIRVWAFQDEWFERERALQPAPGVYNERFLVALDKLIIEASRRGLRLLLCLTNYWEDYGAIRGATRHRVSSPCIPEKKNSCARITDLSCPPSLASRTSRAFASGGAIAYVRWAAAAGESVSNRREDFFTSKSCRTWFKAFLSHVVGRVNTVNGVAYRDEPAIFAWEIINEPRYTGDSSGDVLQGWIQEMSRHVKSLDSRHMLTVGHEGWYGRSSPSRERDNPIGGAERMGGDFTRNFLIPTLDFAVIHLWADLWLKCDEDCKLAFADSWITGHLAEARQTFDKPVLLEEFGKWKPYESRDVFFRRAYEASTAPFSRIPSHAGGAMFWIMHPDNYPFNDDGFGVEVKPDEMGTVEVISAAASVAAGADDLTRPNFPPPSYSPAVGASSSPSWLDPSVAYASPDAAKSTTRPFDTTPRYRFATPDATRATQPGRRVTSYSNGTSPNPAPRFVVVVVRCNNPRPGLCAWGDTLTVFVETDANCESAPVASIEGMGGAIQMQPFEGDDGKMRRFVAIARLDRDGAASDMQDGPVRVTVSGCTPGAKVRPVTHHSGVPSGTGMTFARS